MSDSLIADRDFLDSTLRILAARERDARRRPKPLDLRLLAEALEDAIARVQLVEDVNGRIMGRGPAVARAR